MQAECIRMSCRYLDLLESVSHESAVTAKAQIVYEKKKLEDMVLPKMEGSAELDDIVQPATRLVWQGHACMSAFNLILIPLSVGHSLLTENPSSGATCWFCMGISMASCIN